MLSIALKLYSLFIAEFMGFLSVLDLPSPGLLKWNKLVEYEPTPIPFYGFTAYLKQFYEFCYFDGNTLVV